MRLFEERPAFLHYAANVTTATYKIVGNFSNNIHSVSIRVAHFQGVQSIDHEKESVAPYPPIDVAILLPGKQSQL